MPYKVLVTIIPGHTHVTELCRDIDRVEIAIDVANSYNSQTGLETVVEEYWARRKNFIQRFPAISLEARILQVLETFKN